MNLPLAMQKNLRSPKDRPYVLAYHEISQSTKPDVYHLMPEEFMRHMSVAQCTAKSAQRDLSVSFDDGHVSHIHYAAPVLHSLGITGHFFIPTSWIGEKYSFAGWDDIRGLAKDGHRIGSHGITHTFLTQCTQIELENEVTYSRKLIEDKVGQAVDTISMPGGRWNEAVVHACAKAGYREIYTSEPGMYRPAFIYDDLQIPSIIGRFAVRRNTTLRTLRGYVSGNQITVEYLRAAYHARKLLRQLVGDTHYQSLWTILFRAREH